MGFGSRSTHPTSLLTLLERYVDIAARLQPCRHRQLLRTHEIRIEQLGLRAAASVGEDSDDGVARAELAGEANGARDVDAGRAAEAQTLMLGEIIDHIDRFLVGNEEGIV